MGCAESTVKYLLFIFNLIFALTGLVLLGLGVAGILKVEAIVKLFKGDDQVIPILAIVVGSLVFFVAFFGCCGAILESVCMLLTFSVFMLLLIIVKTIVVIVLFAVKRLMERMAEVIMAFSPITITETDALAIAKALRVMFCGICVGIGALELLAMVFGCCLANHVRAKNRGMVCPSMVVMRQQ